jgi:hypothetical protein
MAYVAQEICDHFNQVATTDVLGRLKNTDNSPVKVERPPLFRTTGITDPLNALYVDGANGNDSWDGTSKTHPATPAGNTVGPKQTVQAAVNTIEAGAAKKWVLLLGSDENGKYRESVDDKLFVRTFGIRGARGSQAWLDGSDIVAGWTYQSGKGWKHAYTTPFPNPTAAMGRMDQLWVDGKPFMLVTTTPGPGEFQVDFTNNVAYIGEASTWVPGDHTIEMSMRKSLFKDITETGFSLSYCGVQKYGSSSYNDGDGVVVLAGPSCMLDHAVIAYCGWVGLGHGSNKPHPILRQVIIANNGMGAHGHEIDGADWDSVRISGSNFRKLYDITPSESARFAGAKYTKNTNSQYRRLLVWKNDCNGWWWDLACGGVLLAHSTFMDSGAYNVTHEVALKGTAAAAYSMRMINCLVVRGGRRHMGNRHNFRVSGVPNAEIYCVTSVDPAGAAVGWLEDSRSHSGGTNHKDDGDTFNLKYAANVHAITDNSDNLLASSNGWIGAANGWIEAAGTYTTKQMLSVDPTAGTLVVAKSGPNLWYDFSTTPAAKPFTYAQPTADWDVPGSGTPAGAKSTAAKSLADLQALGLENGSHYTNTPTIAQVFPQNDVDQYSLWGVSALPGMGGASINPGDLPPWAMAEMGLATGQVRYGCRTDVPLPVAISGGGGDVAPTCTFDFSVTPADMSSVTGAVRIKAAISDDHDLASSLAPVLVIDAFTSASVSMPLVYVGGTTFTKLWDTSPSAHVTQGVFHTLMIFCGDSHGNVGVSDVIELKPNNTTVDTTVPTVAWLAAPANGASITAGSATVTATIRDLDDYGNDTQVLADTRLQRATDSAFTTPIDVATLAHASGSPSTTYGGVITTFASIANGLYYWRVLAKDASNNTSFSPVRSWYVNNATSVSDTTPPVAIFLAPANGASITGSVPVTAQVTDLDNAGHSTGVVPTVKLQRDATGTGSWSTVMNLLNTTGTSQYTNVYNTSGAPVGTWHYRVFATDPSGNSSFSPSFTWTITRETTGPVITGLTPDGSTAVSATINVGAASISDPETGVVSASYEWDGDPDFSGPLSSPTWQTPFGTTQLVDGDHVFAVTAVNGASLTTTASAIVTVFNGVAMPSIVPDRYQDGWNVPLLNFDDYVSRVELWQRVADSGAKFVRFDAYWSGLQPTNAGGASAGANDTFDATALSHLLTALDDARGAGVHVMLDCAYAPDWAHPSHVSPFGDQDKIPATRDAAHNYPDYANFVWNVIDRCEKHAPGVVFAINVWNEPNIRSFWRQPPTTSSTGASWSPDAVEYAKHVIGAYNALKLGQVNGRPTRTTYANITVLAGVTAPATGSGGGVDYDPRTFDATWISSGGLGHFDALDHHPYCWQSGITDDDWNAFRQLDDLHNVLLFFGLDDTQIWCSEIGAVTRPDASLTDATTQFGVGGYETPRNAPSAGWQTAKVAIDYTLAEQRVKDMFSSWRSKSFTGPMCWYELDDHEAGINSDWTPGHYFGFYGFYEQGSDRYNGPAKGNLAEIWTGYATHATSAPSVTILTPTLGESVSGDQVPFVVAVVDQSGDAIPDAVVVLNIVGLAPIVMPWFFVNAFALDTRALTDGRYDYTVTVTDPWGNSITTPVQSFYVNNTSGGDDQIPAGKQYRWYALDADYNRKAEIGPACKIETNLVANDVGTITVTAPFGDACVPVFVRAGAKWELWYGDQNGGKTIASGPMDSSFERDWGAPQGSGGRTDLIVFSGESDVTWIDRRLAHPDPHNADDDTYAQTNDVRSGAADKVIGDYVIVNAGQSAISIRQTPLIVPAGYGALGVAALTAPASARFQNLLPFIQAIAATYDVMFDAHLIGPSPSPTNRLPYFSMRRPVDRSGVVRFSPDFGNIAEYKYGVTRPQATAFYVGDENTGSSRTFVRRYSAGGIARWGRIEGFVSGTGTTGQLQQSGDAAIQQNKAASEVLVTPVIGIAKATFVDDFDLGDTVGVIIDGQVIADTVQAVKITRDTKGVVVAPSVGGGIFDEIAARTTATRSLVARIRDRERV